uniref:Uncharacterized protein n=1 Tax=Prevotella sp. GTC17260 TaxID=3236796 RepID=A0AB33JBW1_9BACT
MFLMMFAFESLAQNVTISPSSGKLVAGLTYDGEIGFERGWSSLWRHNQLPLTLTVSDKALVTESGVLKDPAGDIILDESQDRYVIMSGAPLNTEFHMGISLPKGYRFTGYRIVLLNNVNGKEFGQTRIANLRKIFYETNSKFDTNNTLATTGNIPGNNDNQEYVIERTSKTETDMGNNLYFLMHHFQEGFYGITIKSCELYFTAEGAFDCAVAPGSPLEIVSVGKNMIGSPFETSKLDLGEIKPNSKPGRPTYYSYDFRNVRELTANNWLYQADAVVGGKLPENAGEGSIQALKNGNSLYYALGNNTYYIETPTSTLSQEGAKIPLGYRITGAKIKYYYGTPTSAGPVTYDGDLGGFYITYRNGRRTYYLQTNGAWGDRRVLWNLNGNASGTGKIYSGNNYLYVYKNWLGIHYIYGTTDVNEASDFTVKNGVIQFENGYLVHTINSYAQITDSPNNVASWTAATGTGIVQNPAFTPSPYTLKVYGTDKDNPVQTINVGVGADSEVVLTDLNNDAIKIQIEGLTGASKALITFELTLEALNPFINSIDILCHSMVTNGPKLMQQFTSNDFQVSGGKFVFYVPKDFFGGGAEKCRFTFENLYSKYGDATYGNTAPHRARYFFVKSKYYNDFNGQQYSATGNEPAADKIHTEMCGDKPFKYSNIDALDPHNTSGGTQTLEEYPYSEDRYREQGGTFSGDIVLSVNEEKPCYLFTADETRWNIAPTTAWEHRYYAYYLMDLKLETKDYVAKCELTKLYDATCYSKDGADSELPMYGGKFVALDATTNQPIPAGSAYLTVPMMRNALIDALRGLNGVSPDATGMQVLYLDYTNLYSVHIPEKTEMDAMKKLLNPNCLIYFPERSNYNEDNYIQKTASGDYRACKNIVITDKQPFYAPYKITVPAENYATYTREITVPNNGKVANATVILPFTLELENGVHTNKDGACSFAVNQMNASNCLSIDQDAASSPSDYLGKAYFSPVTNSKTEANVPYMVKVVKAPADDKLSFVATQYGSDVMATKSSAMGTDYTFVGETATGNIAGTSYAFANYGSYSGKKLDKARNVFYFSGDMFLNSKNLRKHLNSVFVYPFRGYYGYTATGSGAKMLNAFSVYYGENSVFTGMDEMSEKADMAVTTGKGTLTFTTTIDRRVQIYAINGGIVDRLSLKAGDTRTIALPAGAYVVNGIKIIVK